MLEQNYLVWLEKDVTAMKCALLVAIEKRDRLLYIEEPALREEYMQKIGFFEEQVLQVELEASLEEKKKIMVQTALNRRETIDMEAIEKQLEDEKQNMMKKINQNYNASSSVKNLLPEEQEELQALYKEIVKDFHPQVHTDITEGQKMLFEIALEAYQKRQLEELRLVHEMLYSRDGDEMFVEMAMNVEIKTSGEESIEIAKKLTNDYSLAAELFSNFEMLEEDAVLLSAKQKYAEKEKTVYQEIQNIQSRFPFVAKETLNSEEKTKEYMESLRSRKISAEEKIKILQAEIQKMVGV